MVSFQAELNPCRVTWTDWLINIQAWPIGSKNGFCWLWSCQIQLAACNHQKKWWATQYLVTRHSRSKVKVRLPWQPRSDWSGRYSSTVCGTRGGRALHCHFLLGLHSPDSIDSPKYSWKIHSIVENIIGILSQQTRGVNVPSTQISLEKKNFQTSYRMCAYFYGKTSTATENLAMGTPTYPFNLGWIL